MADAVSSIIRPVVVAPTFNNARTVVDVLDGLTSLNLPIIVINDGSTDDTAPLLHTWANRADDPNRIVLTFETNRGKAAGLLAGFAEARARGCSHALTIDTDGQHDVADAIALLTVARESPDALIVGHRPIEADYPLASRLGRRLSNAFVRLESGLRISDSQCGLRVYPLAPLAPVRTTANRYGFETEILTRSAWAGIPVIEAHIRCIYHVGTKRITHFRPVIDSLRAARMHAKLLAVSLAPSRPNGFARRAGFNPRPNDANPEERGLKPALPHEHAQSATGTIFQRLIHWMNPLTMWRDIRAGRSDGRFPATVAAGMFMAVIPLYGIKTVVCLLIAKIFRLQPLVLLAVSSLNTPPTGPLLAGLSIVTGTAILHHRLPSLWEFNPHRDGWLNTFRAVAEEWIVGGFVVGILLAIVAYWIAGVSMRLAAKVESRELIVEN